MTAPKHIAILGAGPGGYVAAIRAAQLGFKTAVWVLIPNELASTDLSIAFRSKEVLASIAVKIYPEAHMVEVPIGIVSHSHRFDRLRDVISVHLHQVDATVFITGRDEAIWDNDHTLVEHIHWHNSGNVRPNKSRAIEHDWLQR